MEIRNSKSLLMINITQYLLETYSPPTITDMIGIEQKKRGEISCCGEESHTIREVNNKLRVPDRNNGKLICHAIF